MSVQRTTEILEKSFDSLNNSLDVTVQSTNSNLFRYSLINEQKTDITLTAPVAVDESIINVSAGHGFTGAVGEYIVIRSGDIFEQRKVVSVSTNAITIEMPIAQAFPITSSVIRGNSGLNVDGSVTPVEYKYTSNCCGDVAAVTPIDLQYVVITMAHKNNVGDDGKFGGLPALTNGIYFRKINGSKFNFGNFRTNQDFKDSGAVVVYSSKAPAGTEATNITIDLLALFGQVVRIDPREPDSIVSVVRDVITDTAGMARFTVTFLGSYTRGE